MSDIGLFQNSDLVVPVAGIAFILWMIFVWKESNKPIKKSFYLTIVIALITVLSFAMLALKPMVRHSIQTKVGILTTHGFDQDLLDSLENSLKGSMTFDYKMNKPMGEVLDSLNKVLILGEGIQPFDFWQFENRSAMYLGSNLQQGILELKYTQENVIGANLEIAGRYKNAVANHRIVLQDVMGLGLDSIVMNSDEVQDFKLSASLKAKGKFTFELVEKDSLGETISRDPLPLTVIEPTKLKMALINGYPTFETKYLKNYLSEMGHELVVRSQLTRGRYRFEYFNTERMPIYRLGEKELEDFDLMVIDGHSFRNLSRHALNSIENSIKDYGMGLFVQGASSWFTRSSESLKLEFERDGISKIAWNKLPNTMLEKFPYRFIDKGRLQSLHNTDNGPLTAYRRMQKGKVGTTMVQNTYQLQLEGKMDFYRAFWSEIVNGLAKKAKKPSEWEIQNRFPLINQPLEFTLRTTIDKPQVRSESGNQIPLKQNLDIPTLWTGTTYPNHKGWSKLRLTSDAEASVDYYVVDAQNWKAMRASLLQKENKRYFSKSNEVLKKAISQTVIEPLWFFLLGLVGLSYLWLHPKLFPN